MAQVLPVEITEELKQSFINYAMSVIVDRALPDVRDGLKPVQRRILFGAYQEGVLPGRKHVKSAKIVGEVMGKYHPHGDAAIYDALVRMAQPWNLRYPLIDGQGNFGSIDGDPPAAQRYTEARLSPIGAEMLLDIDKDTVDFRPNYDGSLKEPEVLPAAIPNLLVNGASGIAVGMATSLPPHNLSEVVDALVAMIENPAITLEEVMRHLPGPDFPTGGKLSKKGIKEAYATGRGSLKVRAKVRVEEKGQRPVLVVTEIPYQVNKASLIAQIAALVKAKKIEDIVGLRDESDRQGLRIAIELKRGANPQVVLNQLYKHTALQTSFTVNLLAIVDGEPKVLSLLDLMRHYLDHRKEVVRRRSLFELRKAEERAHVLEGLLIALDHIDEVIALIRGSEDAPKARIALMERFGLSEAQAQAILDMRLQRLVALEREKLLEEYRGLMEEIARLKAILEDEARLLAEVKADLLRVKEKYGDARRTLITEFEETFNPEDLIEDEPMVITLTAQGFLKRLPLESYRAQGRGEGPFGGQDQGGRRGHPRLRGRRPRRPPPLHEPGPGLPPQGLRASRDGPPGPGRPREKPPPPRRGRGGGGPPLRAGPGPGRLPGLRHRAGPRQAHRPQGVPEPGPGGPHRHKAPGGGPPGGGRPLRSRGRGHPGHPRGPGHPLPPGGGAGHGPGHPRGDRRPLQEARGPRGLPGGGEARGDGGPPLREHPGLRQAHPFPSTPSRAGAGWGSSPTPSPPRWGGSPPCSRSGAGRTSWSSPVGASPSAPPWPRSGSTPGPPPASG